MKRLCRFTLGLLLQFICLAPATAQQLLETYTPANGLVDTRVRRMVQDRYGRLWFLTREGFSMYDGQRFTNHLQVNGFETGIAEAFFFAPDSTLYIVNASAVAFKIDKHSITPDTLLVKGITEISDILTVKPGDYLVISNGGLYRITNGKRRQLGNHNNRFAENMKNIGNAVIAGPYMLLSYWQGPDPHKRLYLYDYEQEQLLDFVPATVYGIQRNHAGRLLVNNGQGGLLVNEAALGRQRLQLISDPYRTHLPAGFRPQLCYWGGNGYVFCINEHNDLIMLDAAGNRQGMLSAADGLARGVQGLFTDRENNFWLLVPGKGVQKIVQSPFRQLFQLGGQAITAPLSCSTVPGEGIYINNNDQHVVLNADGRISRGWKANVQNRLSYYRAGGLWIIDDPGTLITPQQKTIRLNNGGNLSPIHAYSNKTAADSKGRLLISGHNLYAIGPRDSVLAARLFYFTDKIAVDNRGRYWAFTRGDKTECFEIRNGRFERTATFNSPGLAPRCAMHWSADTFLLGTRNRGLLFVRVNEAGVTVLRGITRAGGLSSNFVLNCIRLKNGRLLAATAGGADLVSIDGGDTAIQRLSSVIGQFGSVSGLAADERDNVYVVNEDGTALFHYSASRFDSLAYRPRAYFHQALVNGNLYTGSSGRFNYRQNNFRFEVSAPSFIDNRNISFFFSLTGGGQPHHTRNNNGVFEINNLEPGNYRLMVKVVYPGGVYANESLYFNFTITKPFWKTAWFIVICAAAVGGLILYFSRNYFMQRLRKREAILRQQQAVEKERTRIATDMHDDFGASLSRIKFLSEKLKLTKAGDMLLQTDLEKISGYSDEMAEKMGEIVWALNQKYDTLGDLVAFCRSWASEFLSSRHIDLRFEDRVRETFLKGETRRNIFLVLKESLHNTVKHAGAGQVDIVFKTTENTLYIELKDNGKGIDFEHIRRFANGLENMKRRMEECGGGLELLNDGGAVVRMTVPLSGE